MVAGDGDDDADADAVAVICVVLCPGNSETFLKWGSQLQYLCLMLRSGSIMLMVPCFDFN